MKDMNKMFFLIITMFGLLPAIYHTIRGQQTVSEFINGDRKFSTFQLTMTLIATVVSIGGVNIVLNDSYTKGLNIFVPYVVGSCVFHLLMILIMPRLTVFFYTRDFGEAIETIGGKQTMLFISVLACFVSIFLCVGQFKIGLTSAYFLSDHQKVMFLWVIGFTIACYVARGGMNAVVTSDIIQLFIGIVGVLTLLLICMYLIKQDSGVALGQVMDSVRSDVHNFTFDWSSLNLFIMMAIPAFSATYTSRIFLAKNKQQMQTSFKWLSISWVILASFLYLTAKVVGILTNNAYQIINIEIILKSLTMLDPMLKLLILLAYFMFAITTIDSLLQFVTVELTNIFNIKKNEKNINLLFRIMPFILMIIICGVAQFEAKWQINYIFLYSTAMDFLFPTIAPVIFFYVIFQRKFNNSLFPFIGIIIGIIATIIFKRNGLYGSFPSLVGGLANLFTLYFFKNKAMNEDITHD